MICRIYQKNELTLQKNINNIKERFIQDGNGNPSLGWRRDAGPHAW